MSVTRRSIFASLLGLPALFAVRQVGVAAPREVVLLDFAIDGGSYHALPAVRHVLIEGEALALRREPNNPHDPFAVAVHRLDGTKLGYVPRDANQSLAHLMDSGAMVSARIIGFFDFMKSRESIDREVQAVAATSIIGGDPRLRATLLTS